MPTVKEKNQQFAKTLILVILAMVMLTLASVPLYNLFCKVTGYGGTTERVSYASERKGNKIIEVNFDANLQPDLPWEFYPEQPKITIRSGENAVVFYRSINLSNEPITGMATYNVTPHKAGKYFKKIHCFCFDRQLLLPKQNMPMPVSFYIDPEIEEDPDTKDVTSITLSYSFFRLSNSDN